MKECVPSDTLARTAGQTVQHGERREEIGATEIVTLGIRETF